MPAFQNNIEQAFLAAWERASTNKQRLAVLKKALLDGEFCTINDLSDDVHARIARAKVTSKGIDFPSSLEELVELQNSSPSTCLRQARELCLELALTQGAITVNILLPRDVYEALQAKVGTPKIPRELLLQTYRFVIAGESSEKILRKLDNLIALWRADAEAKDKKAEDDLKGCAGCAGIAVVFLIALIAFLKWIF